MMVIITAATYATLVCNVPCAIGTSVSSVVARCVSMLVMKVGASMRVSCLLEMSRCTAFNGITLVVSPLTALLDAPRMTHAVM